VSLEVVDPRTLSPLDDDAILSSVRRTRRVVVVDEDNPRCSMATDIVALVASQAFDDLDAPPQAVTAPHTPVPFSPPLEDFYVPGVDRVVQAVRATL
jgi:acetoin:2,6-dichlorophenolindophenol oxidoreductase subunit beta